MNTSFSYDGDTQTPKWGSVLSGLNVSKAISMTSLCSCILAICYYMLYPKKRWYVFVAIFCIVFCLLKIWQFISAGQSPNHEHFADSVSDDARIVRYGDVVSLFTMKNTFVKQNDTPGNAGVIQSPALTRPEDLPRGSYKELFILEDPIQPAGPGNANPIRYGGNICLRAFNGQYVSATADGKVQLQDSRTDGSSVFIIESDNLQAITSISYGDPVYLKNTMTDAGGMYLIAQDDGTLAGSSRSADSHFSIQDKYGQGLSINWAKAGRASQSSTNSNYVADLALDGKIMTFNSTNAEKNPWWEVILPKEIYLDRIIVKNRVNGGDDITMRLKNFYIIIKDVNDVELARKLLQTDTPTAEFSWNNVYHIGRTIRIQINDDTNQYLHMGEVQVFGMQVNYSVLLNKPIMADLTTYIKSNNISSSPQLSRVFEHQEVPLAQKDMTVAFWITIDPKTYPANASSSQNIGVLIKGSGSPTDTTGIKSPGIWLTPNTPALKVLVSTNQNFLDGINSSSLQLPLGKATHVAVTITSGVSVTTGWKIGNFRPSGAPDLRYVIFNPIQKRYYELQGINDGNYASTFGKVTMLVLDDLDADGFQNMGLYDAGKQGIPEVRLYFNGRLSDSKTLQSSPLFNTNPLTLNGDKLLYANITELRYANYAMTAYQIHSLAVTKVTNLCKTLIGKTIDASQSPLEISHSELPAYDQELSLAFWANIVDQSSKSSSKIPLIVKGTVEDPEMGVLLWETGDALNIPVRTKKYPIIEGIPKPDLTLVRNAWNHFAITIGDNTVTLYVNGAVKGSAALSKPLDSNFGSLMLGGFVGGLQNCRFCNYLASVDEIPMLMGPHPDVLFNSQLKTLFEKAGCSGYPYGIDKDPGAASDLKALLKNGREDEVDKAFAQIKVNADAYIQGDLATEKKVASDMCYGDIKQMNLPTGPAATGSHVPVTCLPTAPFKCPPRGTINDYDIRTHKDFYMYDPGAAQAGSGTCGDKVKVSDLKSDPSAIVHILNSNPDIARSIATSLASSAQDAAPILQASRLVDDAQNCLGSALATNPGISTSVTSSLLTDPKVVSDLSKITPNIVQALKADPTSLSRVLSSSKASAEVIGQNLAKNPTLLQAVNNGIQSKPIVTPITTSKLYRDAQQTLASALSKTSAISETVATTIMSDSKTVQDLANIDPNIVASLKSAPASISGLVNSNPAVAKVIGNNLSANAALLSSVNNSMKVAARPPKVAACTPSTTTINSALSQDPATASSVISDLVRHTKNPQIVKSVAESLIANNKLQVAEVVKQVPPTQLTTMIQNSAGGSISSIDMAALMKDDASVQSLIKQLLASGKITPQMLLSQIGDSAEFRRVVAATCSATPSNIEDHPDFYKFISKQGIPCYGCDFS